VRGFFVARRGERRWAAGLQRHPFLQSKKDIVEGPALLLHTAGKPTAPNQPPMAKLLNIEA